MNQPLNRKQIAVLVLATVLGVASFWIPAPGKTPAPTPMTYTASQAKNT